MDTATRYVIAQPLDSSALTSLDLGPFHLRALADERRHDRLLDTADCALCAGGHALWLYGADGLARLVLSQPASNPALNGEAHPIEASLPADVGCAREHWPRQIAERVGALVGDAELAPVIAVEVRHRAWLVERGQKPVGELIIKDGTITITTTGKSEPLRELEVTLRKGTTLATRARLDRELRTLLPLVPAPESTLERELAALKAAEPSGGQAPLERAARHVLGHYLAKLHENTPAARKGRDSEAIHDMRTSLRRLRSMLQVLEGSPVFDARRLRRLRRGLRPLARRLGQARDLDVLLDHAQEYGQSHHSRRDALMPLRADLQRQRQDAQAALLDELDRPRTSRLLRKLDWLVSRPPKGADTAHPVLVRHFAGSAIWQRYEAVLGYEHDLPGAPPPTLHRLRIACKRLRYTLELFEEALGPGTDPLLKTLVTVQDHLGAVQDHITALATIAATARAHPRNRTIAAYAASRTTERDQLQVAFEPLWSQLISPQFRQDLATLIAAL
jgi:CHAD domain-containing protein